MKSITQPNCCFFFFLKHPLMFLLLKRLHYVFFFLSVGHFLFRGFLLLRF